MDELKDISSMAKPNIGDSAVSSDARHLIEELISELGTRKPFNGFDEQYKWDLLDRADGRDALGIVRSLYNANIVDPIGYNNLFKAVISQRPDELETVINTLFDETADLDKRVKDFKADVLKLYSGDNRRLANDERTVAALLACKYPDRYTFYQFDMYQIICDYFGYAMQPVGKRFSHFMRIINAFAAEYGEQVQQLFAKQIGKFNHKPLNLAIQTLFWCMKENMKLDKYWHIQMHLPEGKGGMVIDSKKMLLEKNPVIGTGEWDNKQCENFKSIDKGSIVLVRRGDQALALCEITGDNFNDNDLTEKYANLNFRQVRILAWAEDYKQPRAGLFSQGTFASCRKGTEQYKYIDGWMTYLSNKSFTDDCVKLLKAKHNIILQGAPGTGKTYNTAAIALSVLGINGIDFNNHKEVMEKYKELQDDRIFFTTFHQSLDYEDFVEGLKPHVQTNESGESLGVTYEPEDGIFKRACSAVEKDDSKDIVECIDDYLQKIKGYENRREIPTVTGKSSLYVWWKDGNKTVSSRSTKSTCQREDDYSPSPLNIEKIKSQALGKGCENNWQQYAQAFIEAVKKEYYAKADKSVVLIIDEINRGNVSKIFGELITLLEADKREGGNHPLKVTLPYSKTLFGVPSNLYIIGTMNTTDRSTGTLDYALRRRFAFVTLKSNPDIIAKHYDALGDEELKNQALAVFDDIEKFITEKKHGDFSIDDLMVGHSYFMASDRDELVGKIKYEVLPLITEYINDGILAVADKEKDAAFGSWLNLQRIAPESAPEEDSLENE